MYNKNHLKDKHPVSSFDNHVMFNEQAHEYTVKGNLMPASVTTVCKQHFEAFDPAATATRMLAKPQSKLAPKYRGKTVDEIKEMWSSSADANEGTRFHSLVERFYNIPELYSAPKESHKDLLGRYFLPDEMDTPEFTQFLEFHTSWVLKKGWVPFRSEMVVFDEPMQLAGTIDMLFVEKEGDTKLHIVDWKRSQEIKMTSFNGKKYGTGPCSDLQDCNYTHYSLQLNLYAAMLLRNLYPEYTVGDMYLVVCHPNYTSEYVDKLEAEATAQPRRARYFSRDNYPVGYQMYKVPPMRASIERIICARLESLQQ